MLHRSVSTAQRRTQEIGIRKISGARIADILRLVLWRISAPVLAHALRLARTHPVEALRYE